MSFRDPPVSASPVLVSYVHTNTLGAFTCVGYVVQIQVHMLACRTLHRPAPQPAAHTLHAVCLFRASALTVMNENGQSVSGVL